MSLAKKTKKPRTYADYLKWDDSVRVELINGEIYDITPAPSREHQEISIALSSLFWTHLKNKKCRVFASPFDVRLPEAGEKDDDITTVVQPDISIICDARKLDHRGCIGAPDLIVEILSPETAVKDMREKLSLYEKHGVKEYWIIHPTDRTLFVFHLGKDGKYSRPTAFSPPDKVKVKTLKGLTVDLAEVFSAIK